MGTVVIAAVRQLDRGAGFLDREFLTFVSDELLALFDVEIAMAIFNRWISCAYS
jgi:hypothetical protein